MPISDVVQVTISTSSPAAQQANFGVPLVLGQSSRFSPDVIRYYTSLAGMVSDGFATTDPEYLAASAIFAQSPRVPKIAVGRRTNLPTMTWDITPVAVNNKAYSVTVNGTLVTYTSDGTATVAEITAGLKAAIDALAISGLTTTDNGGTTGKLHLAMGTAGAWLRVAVSDPALLGIQQTNADAGIATDLGAIYTADASGWYGIVSTSASTAEVLALAAWAESHGKLAIQQSQDTLIVTTTASADASAGASGSVAAQLKTGAYARTACEYHPDNGAMIGAAWMGKCFPLTAGSETWKFKTLAGVASVALTDSQAANAKGKNANVYTTLGSNGMMAEGTVADGEFIDVIRFRDALVDDIQTSVFDALATANKIPYTDAGIAVVENEVRGAFLRGEQAGGLAPGSTTVTAPKASDVSSTDRAARVLNGVTGTARLAGAVHAVDLTVTLTV